jgi:hypothetical protein
LVLAVIALHQTAAGSQPQAEPAQDEDQRKLVKEGRVQGNCSPTMKELVNPYAALVTAE